MNKICIVITFLMISISSFGQSTVGLIAHWDFNGSTNDVSGNSHNGHGNNIIPAFGMDGIYGSGYYFNGTNSRVTVPYSSSFNLSKYSICATINVAGFYTGTCHANTIFTRGAVHTANGIYTLYFCDQPSTGSCTASDTTKNVFCANAGLNVQSSFTLFDYTPRIVENTWYRVVATYDSMTWKVYVNGVLKSSSNVYGTIQPIGSTSDSISIGMDVFQAAAGYPFNFKGIIDDIMLYGRALSDTEVAHYGDTCGKITLQPSMMIFHDGGTVNFSISTSITSPVYQWQQSSGSGYMNLTNIAPFSGVYTPTLTITGLTSTILGCSYRCIVSNTQGCVDTSSPGYFTSGAELFDISDRILIYPNPVTNELFINVQEQLKNGEIQLFNLYGVKILSELINSKTSRLNIESIPSGFYYLRIVTPGGYGYRLIEKSR